MCDDERKLLVKRLSDMDSILREKERDMQGKLGQVTDEIASSQEEMKRAVLDLRQQRQKIAELNDRLHSEQTRNEMLDKINKEPLERLLQDSEGRNKPEVVPPLGAP